MKYDILMQFKKISIFATVKLGVVDISKTNSIGLKKPLRSISRVFLGQE